MSLSFKDFFEAISAQDVEQVAKELELAAKNPQEAEIQAQFMFKTAKDPRFQKLMQQSRTATDYRKKLGGLQKAGKLNWDYNINNLSNANLDNVAKLLGFGGY
jgi:hypothetical protein